MRRVQEMNVNRNAFTDSAKNVLAWDSDLESLVVNGRKVDRFPFGLIQSTGWDRRTFERNAWLYSKYLLGLAQGEILLQLRQTVVHQQRDGEAPWDLIETCPGIVRAAKAFADRLNLPPLPSRQKGRHRDTDS